MNEPPERMEEVARWTEKAEQGLTDIISFHCQQCAEKYLKALLLYRGVAFPRTHDLRLLLDLVPTMLSLELRSHWSCSASRWSR